MKTLTFKSKTLKLLNFNSLFTVLNYKNKVQTLWKRIAFN